jgi:probable rRNA maturation factor
MEASRRKSGESRFVIAVRRDDRGVALTANEIRAAVCRILSLERVAGAELSLAVVDDAAILQVNRDHLGHNYATDVISFLYDSQRAASASSKAPRGAGLVIEGEIVVSAETARREAPRHGWAARSELLLYIVHGLLHLCGYDDMTPSEKRIMRRRERAVLKGLGLLENATRTRTNHKDTKAPKRKS